MPQKGDKGDTGDQGIQGRPGRNADPCAYTLERNGIRNQIQFLQNSINQLQETVFNQSPAAPPAQPQLQVNNVVIVCTSYRE
jgi:hypothetical protein